MKLINRETIKETVSAKSMTLASVVLTGVIALTATGCDAQIKADGITIDSLTITGSDADGILEGADITINGKNVDLTDIAIPTQAVKQADPSDNGNPVAAPSDNKASENNEAGTKTPADTSDDSQVVTPSDNTNADTKADDTASDVKADDKAAAPADSMSLYEAFLNGNAVAGRYWYGEFDDCGHTVSYLIDTVANDSYTTDIDRDNCLSYRYIDCGADGEQELLVAVDYYCGWYDAMTYYLIKDFGGKLYITSSMDSWYRNFVQIKNNGEVTISYNNGAYDRVYIKGFYNAEGKYTCLYICNTIDIAPDHCNFFFQDKDNTTGNIEFYTDGLDVPYKEFSIKAVYIGDDTTPVYTYCIWDENGNDITTSADFESTARIVQIMNYYGLEVYDHCEIEEMVFEMADGYGLLGNVSLDIATVLNRK